MSTKRDLIKSRQQFHTFPRKRTFTHKEMKRVSKGTKIKNRYNQVPHLTQDTNGKVTKSQLDTTNECQEVSLFPAGDHKAHINRRAQRHSKHKTEKYFKKILKRSTALEQSVKIFYWRALSTVCHPEANVLVKKGTLTKMLGCFNENEKDGWDKYLPYQLFSYLELPQDSTGVSPFEL